MGEGLAMFEDVEGNLSNVSFAFRTTQLAAALLEVGTEVSSTFTLPCS